MTYVNVKKVLKSSSFVGRALLTREVFWNEILFHLVRYSVKVFSWSRISHAFQQFS